MAISVLAERGQSTDQEGLKAQSIAAAPSWAHIHAAITALHALDNPVWKALTTHQAQVALNSGMARRFPPEMCVFGGLALPILPAYESLAHLAPEPVGLFSAGPLQLPLWALQENST